MQFVYPAFLWALGLLLIPIIIHLFYFRRRKKVYFTNVRFLKEIKEETDARRNLKNWLILILRLLALSFLVFAFAQPFSSNNEAVNQGRKAVSVFVDNSFSMNALSEDVPLIDRAKSRAREIVNGYNADDQFQILSHELSGRQQRFLSKEEALLAVDEIQIAPDVTELSDVVLRQDIALRNKDFEGRTSYLISDFQKSISDLKMQVDTSVQHNLVPLRSVQENNLSIDTSWFEAPLQLKDQSNVLIASIRNLGSEDVENVRLSLQYDGEDKPVGTLNISAGEKINDTISINPSSVGWQSAVLKITDYPVTFDDEYFISFYIPEKVKVLLVSDLQGNDYLQSGLNAISIFDVEMIGSGNINYSDIPNNQFIILQDLNNLSTGLGSEMQSFIENGGSLLVFPKHDISLDELNSFLIRLSGPDLRQFETSERQVVSLNHDEFVFRDVFEQRQKNLRLPTSTGNFIKSSARPNEETLLRYRDGSSYISKYNLGAGNLYFSFAPLSETYNDLLTNGEIMIPMLYKMAISAPKKERISYTIGIDDVVESEINSFRNESIYKITGKKDFIPGQLNVGSSVLISMNDQVKEAGEYNLVIGDELVSRYSFNYNREESLMQFYNADELSGLYEPNFEIIDVNHIQDLSNFIQESSQGRSFWKLCIIFTLLFLLTESLILRFWKA